MKAKSNYIKQKSILKEVYMWACKYFDSEKDIIFSVNVCLKSILESEKLSNHKRNLLSNYACTLHPNN